MTAHTDATKALVLFSGGQDSATCLAWALSRYVAVETVGFDYGQRHAVELEARSAVRAGFRGRSAAGLAASVPTNHRHPVVRRENRRDGHDHRTGESRLPAADCLHVRPGSQSVLPHLRRRPRRSDRRARRWWEACARLTIPAIRTAPGNHRHPETALIWHGAGLPDRDAV